MSIEDIILDNDRRGVSALRRYLSANFCDEAAGVVLDHPGTAIIATGFYILAAGAAETDGPPGAVAIGNALQSLGYQIVYVTDHHSTAFLEALAGPGHRVVDFPIADDEASQKFAEDLLAEIRPSVLISIERCGFAEDKRYRNMRDLEITPYNARIDYLFLDQPHTVGIGDGGNEIGMGNLSREITTVPTLVKFPCATRTTELIISSVSNWGGYGLVAAISRRRGRDLLPTVDQEKDMIRQMVDLGAVDGITTKQEYKVDAFTLEENSVALDRLHELLAAEGVRA